MSIVKEISTDQEILDCWEVIHALRPHLQKENLLKMTREMQQSDGFIMLCITDDNKPVAFAGIRRMQTYYAGKTIYIDDLSTLPEYRKKGYGKKLLEHIIDIARKEKLDAVHLDSGHTRFEAHRLYLNMGFKIVSHHFALQL
jgi:ribosomal protein S18 acetylase RimI-like enzyme